MLATNGAITLGIALVGAVTGVTGTVVGLLTYKRDRADAVVWAVRQYPSWSQISPGGLELDVVNRGRRSVTIMEVGVIPECTIWPRYRWYVLLRDRLLRRTAVRRVRRLLRPERLLVSRRKQSNLKEESWFWLSQTIHSGRTIEPSTSATFEFKPWANDDDARAAQPCWPYVRDANERLTLRTPFTMRSS